jgi:hypothetical protein
MSEAKPTYMGRDPHSPPSSVNDADNPDGNEATEALPATQLDIEKYYVRLRGIRARQLAGLQTEATQYQVVWGETAIDEDQLRISLSPM